MCNNIFIGQTIRQILEERQISVVEFARRINCSRRTAYNIFEKKSLDIDQLIRISKAIDYDFLRKVYLKD